MGAVLRITMMRRLWYAQTISVFGDFLALFAVISVLTFRLHANAQQITGVQIAYEVPEGWPLHGVPDTTLRHEDLSLPPPWRVFCGASGGALRPGLSHASGRTGAEHEGARPGRSAHHH
ncbi:MAG: hypothetical protein ACJ8EL_14005 [Rhizomicrobium sp.]